MAEPKEIGTVWTLGCEVFIEDALTAEVQEIKVNDIALSANVFTEGLSVEVGSDRVNAMDLDVRISMDGLKTYIIDSQIVPYEDVLKITDFSPEATNEKRYASSANTSKKIIDSVGELEGRVNLTEGDIDALGKRVDDLELKGTGGSGDGFWYLNEQDGKIHTDIGIVVHGDAIVEGDTSSGGEGEDVVVGIQGVRVNGTTHFDEDGDGVVDLGTIESGGGGLTSVSWGDIQGTPPSVSTFDNDVPYVDEGTFNLFSEDVNSAISEVSGDIDDLSSLLSSMWHLDENGNLVTDKQVLIKNNMIVEQDTSSGGEGKDTPSGGISGVKVNGVTYYDDNGDGVIDLGTISGGGGVSGDYLPLAGGRITGNSLDIGREDNYASAFVKIITNASTSADYGTSIRHYEKSSGSYTYKGLLIDKNGAYYSNNGSNYGLIHSGNVGSYAPIYDSSKAVTLAGHLHLGGYIYKGGYTVVDFNGNSPLFGYGSAGAGLPTWVCGNEINFTYGTSRATAMYINSSGNVLIGTTTDSGYKLDVYGTGRFKAGTASDNYTALRLTNAWYGGSGKKNTDIVMESAVGYRGGVIRCTIDAVYGQFDSLSFGAGDNGASSYIPYLTISSVGNVGIGTTSPQFKLDVSGKFRAFDNVIIGSSSYEEGRLRVVGKNGDTYVMSVCDYDGWTKFAVFNNGNTEVYGNLVVSGDVASA